MIKKYVKFFASRGHNPVAVSVTSILLRKYDKIHFFSFQFKDQIVDTIQNELFSLKL